MRNPFKKVNKADVPEVQGSSIWYPIGLAADIFGTGNQLKDFLEIPELNAILNIRARAMASGTIDAYSKTTGLPQASNQSLVRILRRPNWFQGSLEFWRQSSLWRDIFGNEYIYFLTPVGLLKSFKGMFTLNPSQIKIKYKPEHALYFHNATGDGVSYSYELDGRAYELDKESLIHLNDNRVQSAKILEGTSKINSLKPALENIRAAYKKRNIALGMPVGILSNAQKDAIGMAAPQSPEEKKDAQSALKKRGALPILTGLALTYDAMNVNSVSLGLFEETREATAKICDAYGVPYEVLASQKGVTFANLKEAKKQMYEETMIPDVDEKINAINNHIGTETMSWEIQAHFKHLPVFADDMKQRAISVKQMTEALSKMLADQAITVETYQAELAKMGIKPSKKATT